MTAALGSPPDTGSDLNEAADRPTYGEAVLNEVRSFLGRFVQFPSPAILDAVTLWIAHTHVVDGDERLAFDTTPRLAFLSDEPASGKTRALEMVCELAFHGAISVDVTAPGFAFAMAEDRATFGIDEMDVLFGAGGSKATLRSLLNAGYRKKGAVWTRANKEDLNIFGAVAMAGLGKKYRTSEALSALRSRTIPIEMRRTGEAEQYRPRQHDALASELRRLVHSWAVRNAPLILEDWPTLPEGVDGRKGELWEPLFMVANAAGGHWPESVRLACKELALGKSSLPEEPPLSERLLADLRRVFGDAQRLTTVTIVARLYELPGAPWRKLWPNSGSAPRELSTLLGPDVAPIKVRDGAQSLRGYARRDLEVLWADVPGVPDVPDVPDVFDDEADDLG